MGVVCRKEGIGRERRWKEGKNEAVERSMKRPERYRQSCLKSLDSGKTVYLVAALISSPSETAIVVG